MHACVCVGNIHFRWTMKRLHALFSLMFMCRTFDFDTYFSQHCAFLEFSAKIFQLRSTSHSFHICFTSWICCRGATYQTQIKLNLFNLKYFLVLFFWFLNAKWPFFATIILPQHSNVCLKWKINELKSYCIDSIRAEKKMLCMKWNLVWWLKN